MTPLRKKMIDDMVVRGLSDHTIKSYIQAVTGLARHYNVTGHSRASFHYPT